MKTPSLELLPHGPWHIRALIESEQRYEESFGFPAAEGLRGFMAGPDVSPAYLASLERATELDPWTHGFALVHPESRRVIGMASFKGPPDGEGMVEIAYGVVPQYEGRGFATEAARALTGYAFDSGAVRFVRAHTLPEPNASTRVLEKNGFACVGEVIDPEDGRVWRWEKHSR